MFFTQLQLKKEVGRRHRTHEEVAFEVGLTGQGFSVPETGRMEDKAEAGAWQFHTESQSPSKRTEMGTLHS